MSSLITPHFCFVGKMQKDFYEFIFMRKCKLFPTTIFNLELIFSLTLIHAGGRGKSAILLRNHIITVGTEWKMELRIGCKFKFVYWTKRTIWGPWRTIFVDRTPNFLEFFQIPISPFFKK